MTDVDRPSVVGSDCRVLANSNYISVSSCYPGNIPVMAIAAPGRYWRGKAGRLAASKSSASGAARGLENPSPPAAHAPTRLSTGLPMQATHRNHV